MAMVVIGSLPSSLHPPPLPLRFRPPPDPPPCLPCLMSFEALSPPLCLSFLVPSEALSPPEPPDPPPCLPFRVLFEALSLPEPPNPPDPSCRLFVSALCNVLLADVLFGVVTVLLPFIPSPQARIHISTLKPPSRMMTKNVGGGGLLAYGLHSFVVYRSPFGCVDDTSFAYGLHSPVIYMSLFGCVDWSSISSCFDLPTTPHSGDRPMGLVSFGSTFATSSSIYIALARSSPVEEKPIVTFIPMNMEVAGYSPLVPRLSQSYFLVFPPLWSELDEQALLVLQGSSSLRMLFSAYGAVFLDEHEGLTCQT
ncbi:hypothetical protein F2Q70_00013168 [Brassica cretica]|uniref:Uncharacterized protein n=1 Tax=Brassica cretica TaxID=69181 RepID=A0A8S9MEZ8_BRACR|nr:hypothetical protein F2Q70_00013168 [Brassica cretica]